MTRRFLAVIDRWDYCLRQIYDAPASVTIVKGDWKTGKTDFTIHLTVEELKERLKLISEVSGNVRCFEDEGCTRPTDKDVKYIDNFTFLKAWLFRNLRTKAFIYDEALKNTPTKRAMTTLNVEWLRIVPELSKAKCHLFVLTQEESMTEKLFLHPTFRTAVFQKINLKKTNPQFRKMVKLRSKQLKKKFTFKDIPSTRVFFDQYLSATWSLEPTNLSFSELPFAVRVAIDYANNMNMTEIKNKYAELNHKTEVLRLIKEGIKSLIPQLQVTEDMRREEPTVAT